MKTYTFDTHMNAVVTICAEHQGAAYAQLEAIHEAMCLSPDFIKGYNFEADGHEIVSATLEADESGPQLIEVDGEPVP